MHHHARETIPAPYVVPPSERWEATDGMWSSYLINVGTPGQNFRVLTATLSGETSIPFAEGCNANDPPSCGDLRGAEVFNGIASRGFQTNESSTWEYLGLYTLTDRLNNTEPKQYGMDTIALGEFQDHGPMLPKQLVAGSAGSELGYIGLSSVNSSFSSSSEPYVPFFIELRQNNMIPSSSYGYTAGAYYRLNKVLGSLVLGGFDSTRFEPSNTTFAFSSQGRSLLSVGVQTISATNTLVGTVSLTGSGHVSVVDSDTSQIWLPPDVCDSFAQAFGLNYDVNTSLYLVNETTRATLLQYNPIITFRLGNSTVDTKNGMTIVLPYAAFDLQVASPYYSNQTSYFPIHRAETESEYTLGRAFLQEAYLVVDYERGSFSINQAIWPDPLPYPRIVPILPPSKNENTGGNKLSTGAIVGIALGSALFIFLLTGLAFFLYRRRKRSAPAPAPATPGMAEGPSQFPGATANTYKKQSYPGPEEYYADSVAELQPSVNESFIPPVELPAPNDSRRIYEMDGN